MPKSELLDRVVKEAGVSEEVAEKLLGVVVEDLAATLKKRAEAPMLEVPPYFDRYVTTEIGHLSSQITHLREDMVEGFKAVEGRFGELREDMDRRFGAVDGRLGAVDGRFGTVDRRFEELRVEMVEGFKTVDRRFGELREEMDKRLGELREEMDRRFGEVDRRFGEVDRRFGEVDRRFEEMDKRFDRLERWFFAVGIPIILGILAIIFKVFFGP